MHATYTPAIPLLPTLPLPLQRLPHWPLPADAVDLSARVPYPPSAAELARRRPTPLWQAVLLALLLHVWAALLLGSVPPGSAEPGQGVGGAINIRLQGMGPHKPDADAAPLLPAPPVTGLACDAPTPRFGGAVRSQPAAQAEPRGGEAGGLGAAISGATTGSAAACSATAGNAAADAVRTGLGTSSRCAI